MGSTYSGGGGVPTLGGEVPTLVGGGVPTLGVGGYLPWWGGTYPGGGVPTLGWGVGIYPPNHPEGRYPPPPHHVN